MVDLYAPTVKALYDKDGRRLPPSGRHAHRLSKRRIHVSIFLAAEAVTA